MCIYAKFLFFAGIGKAQNLMGVQTLPAKLYDECIVRRFRRPDKSYNYYLVKDPEIQVSQVKFRPSLLLERFSVSGISSGCLKLS